MKIINLTPHAITVYQGEDPITTYPSAVSIPPRLKETTEEIKSIDFPHPLVRKKFTGIYLGDPPFIKWGKECVYIVPTLMLEEITKQFPDYQFIAPDTGSESAVRDERGKIIGIRRFIWNNTISLGKAKERFASKEKEGKMKENLIKETEDFLEYLWEEMNDIHALTNSFQAEPPPPPYFRLEIDMGGGFENWYAPLKNNKDKLYIMLTAYSMEGDLYLVMANGDQIPLVRILE